MGIARNLQILYKQILGAEQKYGRRAGSVTLVAVSKTRSADEIRAALDAGQRDFGESYLQEAIVKIREIQDPRVIWHFIGPIQSNKTRGIAENFTWVHSVDRVRVARRLNDQRPPSQPPLNICLELNLSGEATKSGIDPAQVPALAETVTTLPHLKLRGLMSMPAPTDDFRSQRAAFHRLRDVFKHLRGSGYQLDTLSMGTTMDMEAAIAEGATMVRIGTGVFGPREKI